METLLVLVTSTIASGLGWWLGGFVGGLFTEAMISIIGTAAGVYFGRWFFRTYLG